MKLKFRFFTSTLLYLLMIMTCTAQTVYEPAGNDNIYSFLERMHVKGLSPYRGDFKPASRMSIASVLLKISENSGSLTSAEKDELDFLLREYADETAILRGEVYVKSETEFFEKGKNDRLRMFRYRDNDFLLYADPVLGLNLINDGKNTLHRFNGIKGSGYWGKHFGFSFNFRDNREEGKFTDPVKYLTSEGGINISKSGPDFIEYGDVRGTVSYTWKGGVISAGKEHINIGSGKSGQIILSSKAPSFPFIMLELNPVHWLRFSYIHGWLHSGIIDSSTIRTTLVPGRESYSDISKFIALHILSLDLTDDLTVTLGESIIYSGKIEPVYLIPVMFFRLADHYLSGEGSNTGDNAQLFGEVSYRNREIRTRFYTTLFIDELSVSDLLEGGNLASVGYTAGLVTAILPVKNSLLTIEYTRINPFVYMNSNDVQLYTSHGYPLGHWLGSNGDHFMISYEQILMRGLRITLTGGHLRKGQRELPVQQYSRPYPPFLYGARRTESSFSAEASYEIIHDLKVTMMYRYSNINDEDHLRQAYKGPGKWHTVSAGIGYGF